MILRNAWLRTALVLGIGWSLLWSLVLSELHHTQKLDLSIQDGLIRLMASNRPPPEILLVPISETELKAWGLAQQPQIYARLVNRLIKAEAAVVVINLLPNWVQTSDHPNNPIKALIQQHTSQLVVVLPTSSVAYPHPTEWRNFESFLPPNPKGNPLLAPQSILGFFEYEPEDQFPTSFTSTARQAHLVGEFTLTRDVQLSQSLYSVALLSFQKFRPQKDVLRALTQDPTPVQIQFRGPTGTFPTLAAQSVLSNRPPLEVADKIVLVGFSDLSNPDAFAIQSPYGDLMPALEVQANLLASLLAGSFYRIVPGWLQLGLILLGGMLLSTWIVFGKLYPTARHPYRYWLWPVLGLGGLCLLSLLLFAQGWLLPIALPLFVWSATGVSVFISLLLGIQRDLIAQQRCELDRQHLIEQAAVIIQARKLLHRIASGIHDGPLQELKLVMDQLELLQLNGFAADLNPILDRLQALGIRLRQHLSQTRSISLEITPALRDGLELGIARKLQHLIESGELTLQVIQNLHPLNEPQLDSRWLEAREDIYRFFCEAINNVIRHAQPPYGTASQVQVSLVQHETLCTLTIENDGSILDPSLLEQKTVSTTHSGYGMKLMVTIAGQLPGGGLDCVALAEGGMRVLLSWTLGAPL